MYKQFFKLHASPFGSSPDPNFLYMMPQTREALAGLEYGISARKGIIVLTGEVGTGKTTLLRATLDGFSGKRVVTSFIFNPRLEPLDFLEYLLTDFQINGFARTKAGMLLQLNRWLIDCYRHQETFDLVIDEAQNCSWELLEEIRLLTNLETPSGKLLQIVLSGQPELEEKLRESNARQFRQRVALWCRTYPLTSQQTADYIAKRLTLAGSAEQIFEPEAVSLIHHVSDGIPRLINLICEHALVLAYAEQITTISAKMIAAVIQDLDPDLASSVEGLLQDTASLNSPNRKR